MISDAHLKHIKTLHFEALSRVVENGDVLLVEVDSDDLREVRLSHISKEGWAEQRYVFMGDDQGFYPND